MMHRPLVVLSSSPPHHPPPEILSLSSSASPGLPSPSSFQPAKGKGGSRAAPLPENAVLGFQLASTLPQNEQDLVAEAQIDNCEGTKKVKRKTAAVQKTKTVGDILPAANTDIGQGAGSASLQTEEEPFPLPKQRKRTSKPRAKQILKEKAPNEQVATEEKRGRPKKEVAEGSKKAPPKRKNTTGKVSAHFAAPETENGPKEIGPINLTLENGEVPLIKRKLNWTPPRDTAEPETTEKSLPPPLRMPQESNSNISGLSLNFGYTVDHFVATSLETTGEPTLLKRKRIEVRE
jgi:hypothetical protein